MRVFVDMDGVIADFDGYKLEHNLTGDEMKATPGVYLALKPIPNALESLKWLIDDGLDVWLATKPPTGIAHAYSDKAAWVFKHIPELKRKLIITPDKGLLGDERDILIDDHPERANCYQFKGKLIPFVNTNWATVVTQIRVIMEERYLREGALHLENEF